MTTPDTAETLFRAARYLKRWRDGHRAEAEPPDDIGEVIIVLEQLAAQIKRGGTGPSQ